MLQKQITGKYCRVLISSMIAMAMQTNSIAAGCNENFQNCITLDNLVTHLKAFQTFADQNTELPGSRFTTTKGYDDTRDYIVQKMQAAGYRVTLQDVPMDLTYVTSPNLVEQVSPTVKRFVNEVDYLPLVNSGGADVTGMTQVPLGEGDGCLASDFAKFKAGNIALLTVGNNCTRHVAIDNAVSAGAKAVIVNYPEMGVIHFGWIPPSLDAVMNTPVLVISNEKMKEFKQAINSGASPVIHVNFKVKRKTAMSQNIIAESKAGDANHIVMMGAHIDSVLGNSGMNDNASSVAVVLETALLMKEIKPVKKLRFAFWAGEELGLRGSNYYVDQLSKDEIAKITAYFNYEDLGAPNGGRMIMGYSPDVTPKGSDEITNLYADYFKSQNLKYFVFDPKLGNAESRSDMYAFMKAGVPVGFIASGANIVWNPLFSAIFTDLPNRTLGLATHPCYHKSCDTLTLQGDELKDPNFDFDLYLQMAKAAGYAVYTSAMK